MKRMLLAVALLQICLSAALPKRFVTIDPEEKSLREEITFHPDVNYLQFDVKGQRDAFLQFDFTFLIILGGWGNTKSTLSVGDKILDEYHGPVLDHNNYNSFWISWNRSHIYCGQGINSGDNILMFGTSDCFPGVVDLILRSKFRQTVNWIINKADKDNVLLNNDLRCDNTSTSTNEIRKTATDVSNISSTVNSQTTSTEDTNSIEHAHHTSSTLNSLCSCKCSKEEKQNSLEVPKDELRLRIKKRLDELENEIRINPKTTSNYRATRTSAADDRFSAKIIGFIGVLVTCLLIAMIVLFDAVRFFQSK